MSTELVERLRLEADAYDGILMDEAAEELTALTAKVALLKEGML